MTSLNAQVGRLEDFDNNSMKMVDVEGTAVAVVRTSKGLFALDNACPHQGYGLVTGALTVDEEGDAEITCQWHNWKFRASDGGCTVGQEDVACHRVEVSGDNAVTITVNQPSNAEKRAKLWPSFRSGLEADYVGQISRDTIRLLDAGATPAEIMAEAVRIGAPKNDYGPGHELANAADCLALAEAAEGDDRALPLIQGLAGISEMTRDRQPASVAPAQTTSSLSEAIESENVDEAMGAVVAALDGGTPMTELRNQFITATSSHHLSYGHGAIYVQKIFEMLERTGWDTAADVLPHLARTIVFSTREDTLPYMTKFMRALDSVDLDQLATKTDRPPGDWSPRPLAEQLLEATEEPTALAVEAVGEVGVEGLLDAIVVAVSLRLLRYDTSIEWGTADFGWLDITHGLTYANAARWAWRAHPGPDTARLALFSAWLAYDTGRMERRSEVANIPIPDQTPTPAELVSEALDGRAGSFIVAAHLIKTGLAAVSEAETTGSELPLKATSRVLNSPRRERFVARNVSESLDFIRTGRPPRR